MILDCVIAFFIIEWLYDLQEALKTSFLKNC